MLEVIKAIEDCLENEAYLGALALSLTIPDICGQVESPGEDNVGKRYRKWFDKYYFKYENAKNLEKGMLKNRFDGFICYQLRNSILHNGEINEDIENELKIKYKINGDIKFTLFIPKNDESSAESLSVSDSNGIKNLSMNINVISFCKKMIANASWYYEEYKDSFPQNQILVELDIKPK